MPQDAGWLISFFYLFRLRRRCRSSSSSSSVLVANTASKKNLEVENRSLICRLLVHVHDRPLCPLCRPGPPTLPTFPTRIAHSSHFADPNNPLCSLCRPGPLTLLTLPIRTAHSAHFAKNWTAHFACSRLETEKLYRCGVTKCFGDEKSRSACMPRLHATPECHACMPRPSTCRHAYKLISLGILLNFYGQNH